LVGIAFLFFRSPAKAEKPFCGAAPVHDKRLTVLISDTHFGVGRLAGDLKKWNPYEDFRWQDEFASFLDAINAEGAGKTDLILNGDTFELWQSTVSDCMSDDAEAGCSETEARMRLERVMSAHREELKALGQFANQGNNRLILVPGNHDAALLWRSVAEAAVAATGAKEDRACVAEQGYWLSPDGLIYAEHGQQIGHDVNSFGDLWPRPFIPAQGDYLLRTWGERFVQKFYNDVECTYEIIDNIDNESAAVKLGLAAEGLGGGVVQSSRMLHFLLLDESWAQFRQVLAKHKSPVWDLQKVRDQGATFLVESIADPEMREQAEKALHDGPLKLDIRDWTVDELNELCDRNAAMMKAYEEHVKEGKKDLAPVPTCGGGNLSAIGEELLRSRDAVLADRLKKVNKKLVERGILKAAEPFHVFVYSHTHLAQKPFSPLKSKWTPIVVNTGAWQRVVHVDDLRSLAAERGLKPSSTLTSCKLEDLPACYSIVKIAPYSALPNPTLVYWSRSQSGSWTFTPSCAAKPFPCTETQPRTSAPCSDSQKSTH